MTRPKRYVLVLLAAAAIIVNATAQGSYNYYFTHIDGDDGLSASNVKTILQDSYGFMWFGTKNGLNRYDGTSILQLNCYDQATGTGNNNIAALFEDPNHKIWVGTDRGIYLYDPAGDVFSLLKPRSAEGITPDNWVADIVADAEDNVWVLIPDQGIFCFRSDQMSFYALTNMINFKSESPNCIAVNDAGEVWVGASNLGLYRYNPGEDVFEQQTSGGGASLAGKAIESICFQGDELVIAIHEGELFKYNPHTGRLASIPYLNGEKTFLRHVMCVGEELWVGSFHGLFIINESRQTVAHVKEDLMRSFSLSDNIIYKMYRDHDGGIWIGTMFGGVNYLPDYSFVFNKYVPGTDVNTLNTKRIRGLAEDAAGNIWIGTEDSGMNMLNPRNGRVQHIHGDNPDQLISLCVEYFDDRIYCGLFKQGMDVVSLPEQRLHSVREKDLPIDEGSVYSFLIDQKGRHWIGTGWGLYVSNPNGTLAKVDAVGYNWIFDILEASDGTIWLATMGNGVWKCNPETGSFRCYSVEQDKISSNSVSSVMEDSRGNIWFSTDRGGICRYSPSTDSFTTFSIAEGLPDDVSYNILEDPKGNLWFGTNKGLVKFNPDTGAIRVFTTKDGLLGNQFSYKSALKTRDGLFYFGGIDGLISFDPATDEKQQPEAPLYISRLSIYNREITVHSPGSPLTRSIIHTDKIVLPYNQANLSFDVALLSYATNEANQYYYRMEPVDGDWIRAASNKNITYSTLSPGRYTFMVQACNGSGQPFSTRSLAITILPPWWRSVWAYTGYTICSMLVIYLTIYWFHRRKERQMEESRKLFEIEKEKELYESKVEFFTEIAHEVRTPLSLINGPLEAIQQMNLPEPGLRKYTHVMAQNTRRLLELTGQLLDFQKIGANKLKMKFERVNITTLLRETVARFEVNISLSKKELILNLADDNVWAAVDKEAITKILSNLMNNALKYARKTIVVELEADTDNFTIRVVSDGNKIPAGISQQIFEPFYQTEKKEEPRNGVGIGLSLSRSLALLHKGTLYLDTRQQDNAFVLTVPLNKDGITSENDKTILKDIVALDEESSVSTDLRGYTLLLVEDNEDMLAFLQDRLMEYFALEVARNGREALDILQSTHIDLIVSDIMMPVMNGYRLCREVKSDINLSHIPIIFLTAKNDIDSKINGLKYGAEAYVEKPFSFIYLKEQVFSLLENRRREREAFSKRPFFTVNNMQMNKADEEFMNRVIKIIEDNITDDSFGVERMADILCMSRSSLLRKIKTLFNLSPIEFIRLIKLKKAAEFIQDGKYRIGDICYMVGITSPSYFSKLFLRQFGMTPKDFEKQFHTGKGIVI